MEYDRRTLPSGTIADLDVHRSPSGPVGANIHWGIRLENYELKKLTSETYGVPEEKILDTGFDRIYQQSPHLTRPEAITDEVDALVMAAQTTMEKRGWNPEDIGGVMLGSGVPILDHPDRDIPNYAREVVHRLGLKEEVITRNVYAACDSGPRALYLAHQIPLLEGVPMLVIGAEGITTLSHDPQKADRFSFQVFSNAISVTALRPGVETQVSSHSSQVIPDTKRVLAGRMTYERFTKPVDDMSDPDQIWQVSDDTEMIVAPRPSDGMDLEMNGAQTAVFFRDNVVPFLLEARNRFRENHSGEPLPHIASHHPSRVVFNHVGKGIHKAEGEWPDIPWEVVDGNSSASTGTIAFNRLLRQRSEPGTKVMVLGFGAGSRQDVYVLEFSPQAA